MISCSGMNRSPGSVNTALALIVVGMGWTVLGLSRNGNPAAFVCNLANDPMSPVRRWRGAAAAGAGTGFRNRHWTTAYADSKHIPISFKANPAGITEVALTRLWGAQRHCVRWGMAE